MLDDLNEHYLNWLNNSINKELFSELEDNYLKLLKQAFLDGFEMGRKRKEKENWDLWNQK